MSRAELSGWIQVVIGLVGLYFTVVNGGPALDAIAQVGAGGVLPDDFAGTQGAIRVFLFLLTVATTLGLIFVGLGILLGTIFRHVGAKMPLHAAFSFISAIAILCLTFSLAIFDAPIWPITSLLFVLCIVLTVVAANNEDGEIYQFVLVIGIIGAVVVGGMTSAMMSSQPASAEASKAATNASEKSQEAAKAAARNAK